MKRFGLVIFLQLALCSVLLAQGNDIQLAKQFMTNGETQKALDIYQKLFKQDNDTYFFYYANTLLTLKKFDEAESITKKMERRHPGENQYPIMLGRIYTQKGDIDKANQVYDELIKNLPANANEIANLATQFYQAENVDYAIKIFQKGRRLLGNDKMYSFELINLYRFKRDKPDLVEEYLNFLPDNSAFI